ncbi:MAG: transcription-repair coupling factor, partial [Myxococcota bacterium]
RTAPSRAIDTFIELAKGHYVVHLVHGIGRFQGIERFEKDGVLQEFLALQYRDSVKVYVPVSKIDLIQKYIGSGDKSPLLDKVGGTSWARKKETVETALIDLASDLLQIQAVRRERRGITYPEDSEWQREFEASFPFEDTPDQLVTTDAIKKDMQSERPMDRLICGDVGYGKTELAMRAAFKAVEGGRQVALLVPTTVLAQQHYRTFTERMAEFPITVEVLSRFRSPRDQRRVLEASAEGRVDILIGTHRLLSDDVVFRNLGLVIIDEEQRFGVTHKERLKKMRSLVDVLTLTATPIPRTLHMSLLGMREISSLSTAPQGRTAVQTEIMRFAREKMREIIVRELNRDGQIFFVHNRIHDIDRVRYELEKLVPHARVTTAHGRMKAAELEEVMVRFIEGEIDILISTTIIENGIDIQAANTIFINEADAYGLSELHQLRGRVGRYKHQAYCYLLLPESRHVNPDAEKRLQALVEFSDLGAGFQIAMRDLEIRGAGNILGPQQSGHIAAVGYDMYCRLLERAAQQLREEGWAEPVHVEVDLAVQAFVPEMYLPGEGPRLDIYRRVSQAFTEKAVDDLGEELEDRFGAMPSQVRTLLDIQKVRVLFAAAGIESVSHQDRNLILHGRESMSALLETCPTRVSVLDARTAAVSLVDPRRKYQAGLNGGMTLGDEEVFRIILEWLQTGAFPLA